MKLIKVEAEGFKSFADKISLSFDGGVVGIVGPNGSGKSNINDAIRWVLGNNHPKLFAEIQWMMLFFQVLKQKNLWINL